ncbi:MAG: hypothetical protein ACRENQ_09345 [Gemmatimonadaceae bacterium]
MAPRKRPARAAIAPLDPERIITALAAHRVRYVLIGALAARLQGFPRLTADADITPATDPKNVERLAAALRELGARVFTDGVPEGLTFDCSAATLSRATIWNLVTDAGRLDVAFSPSGTSGYEDLAASALEYEVYGVPLSVASLADIMRSKEAADRPQDRQDVAVIREMLKRRDRT